MDEKLEKIEELLNLFDEREQLRREYNEMIADRIMPTTLAALYELFGLPSKAIEWIDLQILETALVVVCAVSYDSSAVVSPFLKKLDDITPTPVPIDVQRILRIAVPLTMIFLPKDEIKRFLLEFSVDVKEGTSNATEFLDEVTEPNKEQVSNDINFDKTKLTKEQIEQLLYFQHMTKGVKQ